MLKIKNIETFYGNIQALKDISIDVSEGEIITLIGANGAGKSTTLMSLSGVVPVRPALRISPVKKKSPTRNIRESSVWPMTSPMKLPTKS